MILKVCDRCESKNTDNSQRIPLKIFDIQYERFDFDKQTLLGIKKSFELCEMCFDEFMKFPMYKPQVGDVMERAGLQAVWKYKE